VVFLPRGHSVQFDELAAEYLAYGHRLQAVAPDAEKDPWLKSSISKLVDTQADGAESHVHKPWGISCKCLSSGSRNSFLVCN